MQKFEVEKEKKKLSQIIGNIPKNKQKLVEGLIADASFMACQLEKLRNHILEHGYTMEYKNGENQYGQKVSVEADMYIKMQKSYASVIRQLSEYVENKNNVEVAAGESLAKFIANGKGISIK